jgi:hypothetical protein
MKQDSPSASGDDNNLVHDNIVSVSASLRQIESRLHTHHDVTLVSHPAITRVLG